METAVAVIEGSTQSVEALYRADSARLWRAVYAFAGDPDVASDAVAEAYAQVLRRGEGVRDVQAWTWRAAFRIAAGVLKSRGSYPQPLADNSIDDRYADPDLLTALARLPSGQRAAIVLFYYADLPVADIADRLGTNRLVIRTNLSRGRRRLRELLGDTNG